MPSCRKKRLPGNLMSQNQGFTPYALKYPCNYKLGRSRGRTSERFCLPKFPSAIFFQLQSFIKNYVEGRIA